MVAAAGSEKGKQTTLHYATTLQTTNPAGKPPHHSIAINTAGTTEHKIYIFVWLIRVSTHNSLKNNRSACLQNLT